ncbi:MAG: phosphate regulon sensor histidine kinase PhoR [Woeseiaceae bacterium]
MSKVRQQLVIGHLLLLAAGGFIGWLYGNVAWGLLAAALIGLVWQLRQLIRFESALRSRHFGSMKYGDNIWSQMYSQFTYQRQRARNYRKSYRQLLKEVRKSTNAMPDGGIVLNPDFEIVLCNKAAQKLAGFRRKEDRGQRVDNILRDPKFSRYLKSEDFSSSIEIASPVREGSWLQCRIVPYGADQTLLLIQDVSERRRLSTMRREFVANASHELRSPLTVVSGYLDSLSEDKDAPVSWKKPLEQMSNQTARMNNIVAELLELSRLEGAGAAPTDEIVDVCGLLSAAKKSLAGQKNISAVEVDCQSRAQLHGSTAEIESVIVNLLSNATRYTPADGSITMTWTTDADGGDLSVTDTGIGIDPEHVPRLTERFFRVDPGRSRDEGGVGLGLAIVKHILERHAAELRVSSTPGEGSRFVCHFPGDRLEFPQARPTMGAGA